MHVLHWYPCGSSLSRVVSVVTVHLVVLLQPGAGSSTFFLTTSHCGSLLQICRILYLSPSSAKPSPLEDITLCTYSSQSHYSGCFSPESSESSQKVDHTRYPPYTSLFQNHSLFMFDIVNHNSTSCDIEQPHSSYKRSKASHSPLESSSTTRQPNQSLSLNHD